MPPIAAFAFRIIIESLYTGIPTNITSENVTSLLQTAHRLQVQHLYKSCVNYMVQKIDFSNCLAFWLSSKLCNCMEVKKKAAGMIGSPVMICYYRVVY